AQTGLTRVRTRLHAQTVRKSLQTERHPQEKVGFQVLSLRQNHEPSFQILSGLALRRGAACYCHAMGAASGASALAIWRACERVQFG
ncbi:MAG: hypothetical protein ACK4MV_12700, partial [Beijerinckiaceae bacterium]